MQPSSTEAAEALAAMRASQARLAVAADCPPARHLAFAGLMGGIIATPALPFPTPSSPRVCCCSVLGWSSVGIAGGPACSSTVIAPAARGR